MKVLSKMLPCMGSHRAPALSVLIVLLCGVAGCQDEAPVAPEQRMRVVTLADADRTSLAAPQFTAFRDALIRVRQTEAQRPNAAQDAIVDAITVATFNSNLEVITIEVITIIRDDAWTWDERQLMNRALRGATVEDLTVNQAQNH